MDTSNLGNRMKGYEQVFRQYLVNRTPVIVRLDGKSFHTWTKKLKGRKKEQDPYNSDMHDMMLFTTKYIMHHMQNVEIAYTQSDEISILMNDWRTLRTDRWYGNNIQKIVSVTAAAASAGFNFIAKNRGYINIVHDLALFDSRVFNLPKEEVNNYFVWRQLDATRNSINMLGQFYFSHKELQNKNTNQIQDMLMLTIKNDQPLAVNWNDLDVWKKRGTTITRGDTSIPSLTNWVTDDNIPIFTQNKQYIEQHLEAK